MCFADWIYPIERVVKTFLPIIFLAILNQMQMKYVYMICILYVVALILYATVGKG